MTRTQTQSEHIRLRPIALPTEHGGWSLLLEPLLLGMLIAPTLTGLLLGLAALGAFLARHPLELALNDWQQGKRYPRTSWAIRFALLYGLLGLLALAGAFALATQPFWLALLAAAPLVAVQISYDLRRQKRELVPELAGALALGALAPALVLAAGWAAMPALALWALIATRAIPTILYVRTRLRRARNQPTSATPALLAHSAAFVVALALTFAALVPWTAPLALAILIVRATAGLRPAAPIVRASRVGIQETLFGLLTVALIAVGYLLAA